MKNLPAKSHQRLRRHMITVKPDQKNPYIPTFWIDRRRLSPNEALRFFRFDLDLRTTYQLAERLGPHLIRGKPYSHRTIERWEQNTPMPLEAQAALANLILTENRKPHYP